ncbi:hypothetical protein MBGDN05_00267 [Thermoplasmatales archaeon SCGC AB-539-N05]|nr:hypothetical protein MBGDN05_00267 [Thermoplasmatales archaeon SCGC AB-539-N05]
MARYRKNKRKAVRKKSTESVIADWMPKTRLGKLVKNGRYLYV